jgi:hypothetical protein
VKEPVGFGTVDNSPCQGIVFNWMTDQQGDIAKQNNFSERSADVKT